MPWITTREQRRQLARDNMKYGVSFVELSEDHVSGWIARSHDSTMQKVFRNRDFLVQQHRVEAPAIARLSIMRTMLGKDGEWLDGITWDTLQRIKDDLGYEKHTAIEIYPPLFEIVHVANIRHLFIMAEPFPFQWTSDGCSRASRGL